MRTFPKVSGNIHRPDFGRYCKYQPIKFKPWEGEPSNAWGNEAESDEMFINTSYLFLHTDFAEENVIGHDQKCLKFLHDNQIRMKVVIMMTDTNESDDDDGTNNDQHEETDHWMLLCRLNQHYEQSGDLLLEIGTDWFEEAGSVPTELLRECPGWISKHRKDAEKQDRQPLTAEPQNGHPAVDAATG